MLEIRLYSCSPPSYRGVLGCRRSSVWKSKNCGRTAGGCVPASTMRRTALSVLWSVAAPSLAAAGQGLVCDEFNADTDVWRAWKCTCGSDHPPRTADSEEDCAVRYNGWYTDTCTAHKNTDDNAQKKCAPCSTTCGSPVDGEQNTGCLKCASCSSTRATPYLPFAPCGRLTNMAVLLM